MKIAVLIQCHKNPKQINLLLNQLDHPSIDCYIHIDKKADFANEILKRNNVFILRNEKRVSVEWGQISQVTATLNLLDEAYKLGEYDFYWLISGQDWPICSIEDIVKYFKMHNEKNFVQYWNSKNHGTHVQNNLDKRNQIYFPKWMVGRKIWQRIIKRCYIELTGGYNRTWRIFLRNQRNIDYYYGSSWWALNRRTIEWCLSYLENDRNYYTFFKYAVCLDESFFQTLVMLSPYADEKTDYLTYLHFHKGANSPEVLCGCDFAKAKDSNYLIMRKVDIDVDNTFLNYK